MTVLEECGIKDSEMGRLHRRGLTIPNRIVPSARPLKSPSEDWWVYATDDFTPPLTKQEFDRYVKSPREFCRDFLRNLDLLGHVCGILFDATTRIDQLADPDKEAAASLAVLHVFQGALDYHYYRWDRHFELLDTEESPVGYHWKRLERLCAVAARKLKKRDPDSWASGAVLALVSTGGDSASTRYLKAGWQVYEALARALHNIDSLDTSSVLAHVSQDEPEILGLVTRVSKEYRQFPQEVIAHAMQAGRLPKSERPSDSGRRRLLRQVRSALDVAKRDKLGVSLSAVRQFKRAQEIETFRFYGATPQGRSHVVDPGYDAWERLVAITSERPQVAKRRAEGKLRDILDGNPMVGTRKLLLSPRTFFSSSVLEAYERELKRWVTLTV